MAKPNSSVDPPWVTRSLRLAHRAPHPSGAARPQRDTLGHSRCALLAAVPRAPPPTPHALRVHLDTRVRLTRLARPPVLQDLAQALYLRLPSKVRGRNELRKQENSHGHRGLTAPSGRLLPVPKSLSSLGARGVFRPLVHPIRPVLGPELPATLDPVKQQDDHAAQNLGAQGLATLGLRQTLAHPEPWAAEPGQLFDKPGRASWE